MKAGEGCQLQGQAFLPICCLQNVGPWLLIPLSQRLSLKSRRYAAVGCHRAGWHIRAGTTGLYADFAICHLHRTRPYTPKCTAPTLHGLHIVIKNPVPGYARRLPRTLWSCLMFLRRGRSLSLFTSHLGDKLFTSNDLLYKLFLPVIRLEIRACSA